MDEQKIGSHKVFITDRENINITGVNKVVSSNQNQIVLNLKESDLIVLGTNLSIVEFNDNNIQITGTLDSLKYTKQSKNKESFFKRIFK